jgi:hypothetical protein
LTAGELGIRSDAGMISGGFFGTGGKLGPAHQKRTREMIQAQHVRIAFVG